jgi:hypothetical protein
LGSRNTSSTPSVQCSELTGIGGGTTRLKMYDLIRIKGAASASISSPKTVLRSSGSLCAKVELEKKEKRKSDRPTRWTRCRMSRISGSDSENFVAAQSRDRALSVWLTRTQAR